ncbi:MAG: RecX family transcriptional regulator [Bacilli bacterium]
MIKIVDIKTTKKAVTLVFDNDETINISNDTKQEFFLYVGKEIDTKTLKKIVQFEANRVHFNYILRVLSRGAYTTYEVKEKLKKKGASAETIQDIVQRLIELSLLDDVQYTKDKVHYLINIKRASNFKIVHELKRRGVDHYIIEDVLSNTPAFEINALHHLIPKLIKKYEKESLKSAAYKINNKLYSDGFKSENINEAFLNYHLEDYINEDENLKHYFTKITKELRKKGKLERKVVYNKLRKAGYPDHKITLIIKERINED